MYRRARAKTPDSMRAGDIKFHAWRKAIKELGYALETWSEGDTGYLRKLAHGMDRLQKGLGEAQDLALLEKAVRAERGPLASLSEKQMGKAARRKRKIQDESLRTGKRVFKLSHREFRKRLD
jgi:CHAD domain-containing protein